MYKSEEILLGHITVEDDSDSISAVIWTETNSMYERDQVTLIVKDATGKKKMELQLPKSALTKLLYNLER
jgi:hypothetical protein